MSWGDSIREYEQMKKTAFPGDGFQPATRVSAQERLFREREVNNITLKYKDPAREELYQTTKLDALKTKASIYEEAKEKKYNILTHIGPPKQKVVVNQSLPKRDWNFVSHLPVKHHSQAPLLHNEDFNQSYKYLPKSLSNLGGLAVNAGGREFSVVNNRFNKNHEQIIEESSNNTKDKLVEKYWRTHTYDPIRMKYYDPDREIEFQSQRELSKTVQGLAQLTKIAPSIKNAEGFSYNIINNDIINEEKLQLTTAIKDRSLSKTIGPKIEKQIKERAETQEALDDTRRLNRLNYERYKGALDLGYNPVNNMEYVYEPEIRPPLPHHTKLRPMNTTVSNTRDLSGATVPDVMDEIPIDNSSIPTNAVAHKRIKSATEIKQMTRRREENNNSLGNFSSPMMSTRSARSGKSSGRASVPSLDLSRTGGKQPVTYVEPTQGPASMPVKMVRTGGF